MRNGQLFIDHVFMLIEPTEVAGVVQTLTDFGLTESSRRPHPGLGTSNIFFCFDNIFLEILWVENRAEASGTELGRQLRERLDGRGTGAMPFGIGFRTLEPTDAVPFETWYFEPPAALAFKPVPIAHSSHDRSQPVLFRAQRASRPDAWTDGKAGVRQAPAGIKEVTAVRLTLPIGVAPSVDLRVLQDLGVIELENSRDMASTAAIRAPSVTLTLSQADGQMRELVLTSPLESAGPLRGGDGR